VDEGSASSRYEAVLANAAAISRWAACPLLVASIVSPGEGAQWLRLVAAATGCYSLVSGVAYWRRRRTRPGAALADLVVYAAALCAGAVAQAPDTVGLRIYNHVSMVVLVLGVSPWPLWAAVAAGGALGGASMIALVFLSGTRQESWYALPDALVLVEVTLIAWVVAAMFRRLGRRADEARLAAFAQAGAEARERQRAALAARLQGEMTGLLRDLTEPGIVADERLREQLRADVDWLDEHFDLRAKPSADLKDELARLTTEKAGRGLSIGTRIPDRLPPLSAEQVEALVGAAREALNNVAEHAGTADALLDLRWDRSGVTVVIRDEGRGFDPATVVRGVGLDGSIRGRLAEVGGEADIASRPGQGTVVTLWIRN
jgi:signal transduction histidine kinase